MSVGTRGYEIGRDKGQAQNISKQVHSKNIRMLEYVYLFALLDIEAR